MSFFRPARAGGIFEAAGFTALSIGPERSRRRGPYGPCPRTPRGLPFLNARKGSKRSFKGTAVPLKIPCWGALWPPRTRAVPFCRYATFPPHCGGIVPSPTAGFLSGNSRCSESALAFFAGLLFPISALYQVRASRPSLRELVRANYARSSAALWNFVPTLGLWGSSGSEMPSHFR